VAEAGFNMGEDVVIGAGAEPVPRWAQSLAVHSGRSSQSALAQVLLAVIAISCLVSGLCGHQRLERLASALGLKYSKEGEKYLE